jgi:hypothetical protein
MAVISKPNKYLPDHIHIGPPLQFHRAIWKVSTATAGGDSDQFHFIFFLYFSSTSLFSLDQKSRAPLLSNYQQRRQYDTALQLQLSPRRLWMCNQVIRAQSAQATI